MITSNSSATGAGAVERQEPSPFANTALPKLTRTTAGLEPYAGQWGSEQIAHLLRRTMFGATRADIAAFASLTVTQAVDLLLYPPPEEPSQPLSYEPQDVAVAVGTTWVNAVRQAAGSTYSPTTVRTNSLKAWWISLMLNQPRSIREKMVLFWHNHFVSAAATVAEPRFMYRYFAMLRANALGNFRTMARLVTLEGAMLRYLNGNVNTKSSPNENYGRELQELFTIGKGPQVAPGDYTTYTEADVKAAARVLTGWKDYTRPDGTIDGTTYTFNSSAHDTGAKTFSARYGGVTIAGGTDASRELDEMLTMIFDQWETAKFICRKLYRWFVYYAIDDWTEANIITPLATTLRASNFEIVPVLRQLFRSAHFFDPLNRACIIKSPVDFVIGLCRENEVVFPSTDVAKQYPLWNYLWTQASSMQQNVGDPPDVSGWHAYYQEPQFHELWINSDTLPRRYRLTDLMTKNGYTTAGATIVIDVIALAKRCSNPADPNVLVDELSRILFAIPVTASQRTFLKNTLLPGLPDYEWAVEWAEYTADPANSAKLAAVKGKLQSLVKVMMQMPEFQLM